MEEYSIQMGIDWGTWKCAIAYALSYKGERTGSVTPVLMSGRAYEVPMLATWHEGKFVHGFQLEDLADQNPQLGDKIIDLFKLPLYRDTKTSAVTRRVEGILSDLPGSKTLDMLITEHLRAVVADAREAIFHSRELFCFPEESRTELLDRALVRVTVPQMWDLEARRRMQMAAKNSGLNIVTLAPEPKCALSYLVDRFAQQKVPLDRRMGRGNTIEVADLGSGTTDVACYKLLDTLSPDSRLQHIGHSSGGLCGSSKVDEILWKTLVKRKGNSWVGQCALKLQISERDFIRRTLRAIERAKTHLGEKEFYHETVQGKGRLYETFDLSKREIEDAMDEVISSIIKIIDAVAHKAGGWPDVLEVTGGFAKSKYLFQTLQKCYRKHKVSVVRPNEGETGQCFPVAVGSLLRYDNIEAQPLPNVAFAMLQRQVFDEAIHADSYEIPDFDYPEDISRKRWVKRSPYDRRVFVVDDRIVHIVEKGRRLGAGDVHEPQFSLEFRVPLKDPHLTAEFVYLTKEFKENEAAKTLISDDSEEEEYEFKPGVHPWASVNLAIDKRKLEGKGFNIIAVDEEKHWMLRARVVVRCRGEDLQIGFKILKPSTRSHNDRDSSDEEDEDEFAGEVAFEIWETFWESSHSEFLEVK